MDGKNEIRKISLAGFFPAVVAMKAEDWKGYDMVTLRLEVEENEEIASITHIYPCAFLQENEAEELFGVKIGHIEPDYHDKLYRIDEETPFKKKE